MMTNKEEENIPCNKGLHRYLTFIWAMQGSEKLHSARYGCNIKIYYSLAPILNDLYVLIADWHL